MPPALPTSSVHAPFGQRSGFHDPHGFTEVSPSGQVTTKAGQAPLSDDAIAHPVEVAGDEPSVVLGEQLGHSLGELRRPAGHVGSEYDVLEVPQRRPAFRRFIFGDVERGAADVSRLQGVNGFGSEETAPASTAMAMFVD